MGWKSCPHIKKLLFMKKFSVFIVLICICIGFSGCALFVPVWECLTEPSTTYYYYGGCYHTTPPHRHTHYHTGHHWHHGHGHKHRPTAHPHKPHKPHKPSGEHVGGHKPTGRPSGSGSRTGGSITGSGSRR